MDASFEDEIRNILKYYNVEDSDDNREHFYTLMEALVIYNQRTKAYGQVWKRYGALANLLSAARKTDRLMEFFWRQRSEVMEHKDSQDDAVDLINYTVFFLRLLREGKMTSA